MHGRVSPISSQAVDEASVTEKIDLRQLQDFVWRRWRLIAATTFAVMALAFLVLLTLQPRYTSTAQILLEPRKEKIFGSDNILPELSLDAANVDSQLAVLQSANLLRRVVEKEKLTGDPEFNTPPRAGLLDFVLDIFKSGENDEKPKATKNDATIPPEVMRSIKRLREALDVQRVNRTYVLSISVTLEDPDKATRLANAVADAFVVDKLDARYDAARRASSWLAERMEGLREQVRQSEEAVAKFRRDNNLVTTTGEGKITISEQQLSELNAKLISARAETAEKRAKYEQATQVSNRGGNLQAIPDVVRSQVIGDLRKQQAEVARKEADLVSRYNDQHPMVVNARAERRDVERSISAEVQRILINLKNDFDVAKSREESLQASLASVTGQSGLDNTIGVQLRALERVNAANKTLFDNFLNRAKITQEQSTFEEREARVISPATRPVTPSFPKKGLSEAIAGVIGLMLGVGGAAALDMLNSGFTSSREIEEKVRQPVLSAVPLISDRERKVESVVLDPARYIAAKPMSRYAESVRAIRVGIQMSDVDNPAKVILVTSSVPQEGKSTLIQALAISAGKAGHRVLIVDCDLRHPSTSKYFGAENKSGLVDLLAGTVSFEQATLSLGGIMVLPAGTKTQNPPDLLGSARMKKLVENMRAAFDYVLIDSPPLEPVVDAKVLTALVDKVLFVVRWKATPREIVIKHLDYLGRDHRLAGIALNLVDEAKAPRYGAYSHHSGQYYKKYYEL